MVDYALKFKLLRKEFNLNKNQLADNIGVKPATISAIELSRQKPSLEMISKICNIYHVEYGYFFTSETDNLSLLGEPVIGYENKDKDVTILQNRIKYLEETIEHLNKIIQTKDEVIDAMNKSNDKLIEDIRPILEKLKKESQD